MDINKKKIKLRRELLSLISEVNRKPSTSNFTMLNNKRSELDRIDFVGTFRSDDEVGFFFQAIYSLLKRLNDFGLVDLDAIDESSAGEEVESPSNTEEAERFYSLKKEMK